MIHLVEQTLGFVGNLIGRLLDWPFLLLILVVWLVSCFRDQIGSMLDRRSAVGAGELSKKIHAEVDPVTEKLGVLTSQVADLQSQMRKVEDVQSIERQNRMLKPIVAKVETLEKLIPQIQAGLSPLKESLGRVDALVGNLASKEDLETLKSSVAPMDGQMKDLREMVAGLQTSVGASPWNGPLNEVRSQMEPLNRSFEKFSQSLEALQGQVSESVPKAVTDKLQHDVPTLSAEISAVKATVESLTGRIDGMTAEVEEIEVPDAKKIEQEFKDIKEAIRQLQSLHPSGAVNAKAKKRGKTAPPRPLTQSKI